MLARLKRTTLPLFLSLSASPLLAADLAAMKPAEKPSDAWTLSLYFENDLFTDSDQQYTNGIRASWVSPEINNFIDDPLIPQWLRSANRRLTHLDPEPAPFERDPRHHLVVTLGQQMYTPKDRERTTLDPDDRPYAGWLYMGFGYHTQTRHKLKSFEFNLGVVGPWSLAEESQNFIHDLRGLERFEGWDNQLHNEPGIQLIYERKQRLFHGGIIDNIQHDLIGHVGGSLGNVATYLNTGAEYRIGYMLPHDFGTSALRPGGDNSTPGNGDPRFYDQWGIHAFLSLDGRWVMRDIFLDGNTFRDSHSVDKRPLVGDAALGVAATYDRWKLSLARYYRSQQFEEQEGGHKFGSISLSYSF